VGEKNGDVVVEEGGASVSGKEVTVQDESMNSLQTVSPPAVRQEQSASVEEPRTVPVPPPAPAPVSVPDSQLPVTSVSSRPAVNSHPVQAVASQQSQDPWLDRAIIGVLIALVFMILRRIAGSEE
ncbi:hypothetical protein BBP40_005473, partial [Aspergillus hancockii]